MVGQAYSLDGFQILIMESIDDKIISYFKKYPDKTQMQIAKAMNVSHGKVSTVLTAYFKIKQPN
ncbi:hypothetical protein D3C78_1209990 [compost metagenome]